MQLAAERRAEEKVFMYEVQNKVFDLSLKNLTKAPAYPSLLLL